MSRYIINPNPSSPMLIDDRDYTNVYISLNPIRLYLEMIWHRYIVVMRIFCHGWYYWVLPGIVGTHFYDNVSGYRPVPISQAQYKCIPFPPSKHQDLKLERSTRLSSYMNGLLAPHHTPWERH